MKCRDCKKLIKSEGFVRCSLGLWDNDNKPKTGLLTDVPFEQWYSDEELQLNRGPVRRHGDKCTQGQPR
jgi:hypothetical protein